MDEGWVPADCKTTKFALSLIYQKVHCQWCPLCLVERELRADLKIVQCPTTNEWHIVSDTFYGLRIQIESVTDAAARERDALSKQQSAAVTPQQQLKVTKLGRRVATALSAKLSRFQLRIDLYKQVPVTAAAIERTEALLRKKYSCRT